MSRGRILAVARRVAQGFRRDERTLGLMFVAPLVIVALLGWVMRDSTDQLVRVMVVNEVGEPAERIVDALTEATTGAPDGIEVVSFTDPGQVDGPSTDLRDVARQQIRDGNVDLALVLPASLIDDVLAGRGPVITVITEGIEPGAEAEAFGKLQGVMATVAREIVPPGAPVPVIPEIQRETVYLSPDADQVDVFGPIFLGYFGYFFVYILTGISFLRERVGGTLERLLATPVTRTEIVLGYSLGFSTFATLQVLLLALYLLNAVETPAIGPIPSLTIGLGVESAGSPVLALLIAVVLAIGAVNLGIFLSTFARTELQIMQFIPIVIVPQGLLSGMLWPVERLPDVLQVIAHALPMTYAVEALREVMLRGADLSSPVVQLDLAVLAGIAVLFAVIASATIKREVA